MESRPKKTGFGRWWLLPLICLMLYPAPALALNPSQVFEQVKDSVMVGRAYDQGRQVGLGSGMVLPSGLVATNYHLAQAGGRLRVSTRGKSVAATLIASDPERDLASFTPWGWRAPPPVWAGPGPSRWGTGTLPWAPVWPGALLVRGNSLATAGQAATPHPYHCDHLRWLQRRRPVQQARRADEHHQLLSTNRLGTELRGAGGVGGAVGPVSRAGTLSRPGRHTLRKKPKT